MGGCEQEGQRDKSPDQVQLWVQLNQARARHSATDAEKCKSVQCRLARGLRWKTLLAELSFATVPTCPSFRFLTRNLKFVQQIDERVNSLPRATAFQKYAMRAMHCLAAQVRVHPVTLISHGGLRLAPSRHEAHDSWHTGLGPRASQHVCVPVLLHPARSTGTGRAVLVPEHWSGHG